MMSLTKADTTALHAGVTEHNPVDALLETCWLLAAILAPLVINLWTKQPFEPTKAALLRSLAWTMAGLWLVDSLRTGKSPWQELHRNPLLWPVLAVAATQAMATLFATDRGLSLYGSYERAQGGLTQLSYVLLFLVVSARLRTHGQAQRLVTAMVFTAVPVVGLGLAQATGWQPVDLVTDAQSPLYTTLGRSNFTGAYLAMLLPLTVALALIARPRWQRLAGLGLALGELIVIALTLARGAWLAAGVAAAACGLLWVWPRLARRWRIAAAGGGLVALAGLVAGLGWLSGQGTSAAARLAIWHATLDLIARRPLLGYGPEALGLVSPRVYPPQLVYYQGRGILVDRAHNVLLDWAVTSGVLGLLAGIALLAAFFTLGWRAVQQASNPQQRALLVACLAAVAGNVAGNLVTFDVTATATAAWLLLALLPALGVGAGGGGKRFASDSPPLTPTLSSLGRGGIAVLLALGIAGAIFQFNIRPLTADIAARAADDRAATGDWLGAIAAQERAVTLWSVEPVHHRALSWAYLQQAGASTGSPLPWLERAEAELWTARDLRPGDYRIWAAFGELYAVWGRRWDAAKLDLAHDAYRQATALAPNHAFLYTGWGLVDLEERHLADAVTRFRQAVELDATDGYAFAHLGDAEFAQGHADEALAAYLQAVHWAPELSYAYLGLARCYWQQGRREAATAAAEQALQLDPGNSSAWALRREMDLEP
jgi:tetratricopeptide (TPR) repeat protein